MTTARLIANEASSLRNLVFVYFILRHFRKAVRQLRGRGLIGTGVHFYKYVQRIAYGLFLSAPGIRGKVQGQVDEALKMLEDKLVPKGPGVTKFTVLPKDGFTDDKIKEELTK